MHRAVVKTHCIVSRWYTDGRAILVAVYFWRSCMVCGGIVAGYVVVSVGDTSADARGSNCHTAATSVILGELRTHGVTVLPGYRD